MHGFEILSTYICLLGVIPSQCYETRILTDVIPLNNDNSLTGDATIPNCPSGSKIYLRSYTYSLRNCHYVDGCHIEYEEPLSNAAEYLLYQSCSWREKCHNLSFPMRSSEQKQNTNSVRVTYSCIEQRTLLINICEKSVRTVTQHTFLTIADNDLSLGKCECFINKGKFSLTIDDARLMNHMTNSCSSAVLLINSEEFACDSSKEDFGSVFRRQTVPSATNVFLSVKPNSVSVSPDMILLRLAPDVRSKITCFGQKSNTNSTPKFSMIPLTSWSSQADVQTIPTSPLPNNTRCPKRGNFSCKEPVVHIVAIVVLSVGVAIMSLVLIFMYQSQKKLQKKLNRLPKEPSIQTHDLEQETNQTNSIICSENAEDDSSPVVDIKIANETVRSIKCVGKRQTPEELQTLMSELQGNTKKHEDPVAVAASPDEVK